MQSGLVESWDNELLWDDYEKNRLAGLSARDMIERSVSMSARHGDPPDQRTEYTNVNYILLGEIVEKESGEDLGAYITQNILEPLGLENTIYPTNNKLPGDLHGYDPGLTYVEPVDTTIINPASVGGAAAMISDISDPKTWAKAVCTGKLLKPQTHRARLQTRPIEGGPVANAEYGEGIAKVGSFCGHSGGLFGFGSQMWYLPQRDATIVVSLNRTDPGPPPPADMLAQSIMKIVLPKYASW